MDADGNSINNRVSGGKGKAVCAVPLTSFPFTPSLSPLFDVNIHPYNLSLI